MRRLLAVLGLSMLAACGGGADSALEEADEKLADVDSATLDLAFEARAVEGEEETGPVGFRLQGPFSFESEGELPVADLRYTRLLGRETQEASFISTGSAAFVRTDGRLVELDDEQVESLRLDEGDAGGGAGLDQLDLAQWVEDPKEGNGPRVDGVATTRVTGRLNVAEALGDIARLAAQLGAADSSVGDLSDDDRRRLARLADARTVEVVTGEDDGFLRRLRADVTFRPATADQRLRALAGARLTIRLDLSRVNQRVEVNAPR
jgi:hypothetical protein